MLALPLHAQAVEQEKKFSIGIGTYYLSIFYDDANYNDDDLFGFGLSASYAFTDNFAISGQYYSLEYEGASYIEATGIDLAGYFGTGLATQGIKGYIGGGLFSEEWESPVRTGDYNGLQLKGGIGYNWDVVSLDFVISLRDAGDYEDFIQENLSVNLEATAHTGSVILSVRF